MPGTLGGKAASTVGGRRVRGIGLAGLVCTLLAQTARAEEPATLLPFGIEMHGFASQGFVYTTNNQFLADSEQGSFEFTEIGLNFTKQLTDEFRFGAQIFARDLGPVGNYRPAFDWFYIDYRFFDWFGVRAGRTKLPFGLYNETSDIDAARIPILLPQSIYPARNRDFLLAQTGLEAYGYVPLGGAGALDYRLFGGTIYYEPPDPQEGIDYGIPYIAGARAIWQSPLQGLTIGASGLRLRLDQEVTLPPEDVALLQMAGYLPADFSNPVKLGLPIEVWAASAEYIAHDFQLAAEYSRSTVDFRTSEPNLNPLLFPPSGKPPYPVTAEAYYAMAAYRVTPWFTPGVYYSVSVPNVDLPKRRDRYLHDLALFVRYDINPHWLVKLEAHYMTGTAGLERKLNDLAAEEDLKTLTRVWGAYLFKTTGYF